MSKIEVEGMHRLHGEIRVQGSKNSVLPILSACVLNKGKSVLHGCPKIQDVFSMVEVLESAGAKAVWEGHTLCLDTSSMESVPFIEKAGNMRSSVMLLGSFLARFGKIVLGYPGGCRIGKRPIDLHEQALTAMGASFCDGEEYLEASCERLEGCDVYLPYSSVGVTENLLLAAAGAVGMTRIFGAAREPEIVELCRFLTAMGIHIYGIGTEKLFVMGGTCRRHVEYKICTDRIVAGTYLLAAAAAGGEILLREAPLEHMRNTLRLMNHLGAQIHRDGTDVRLRMNRRPRGLRHISTAPYPGFPTDLQSPLLAVLCKGEGPSCIEERLFENRFLVVKELQKMGAKVRIRGRRAFITPVRGLTGCDLEVMDLRGGAALVIAALSGEGVSVISHGEIISRGYEDIGGDLKKLGAVICTIS